MTSETDKAQDIAAVPLGDGRYQAQFLSAGRTRLVRDRHNRPRVYGTENAAKAAAGEALCALLRGDHPDPATKGKIIVFRRQGGIRLRNQIGVAR